MSTSNKTTSIQSGDSAPSFTLPTQNGNNVSLDDYLGKKTLVLFFYPKDDSSGCTAEVCSFRDNYEVFKEAGAEVIGISSDSETSHQKFTAKNRLPFQLLSDQGGKVRKLFGVPTTLGFIPGRVTYIIDKGGIVRHTFTSLTNIDGHIADALRVVKEISAETIE